MLDDAEIAAAAVDGCLGVRRLAVRLHGPRRSRRRDADGPLRRDPLQAAARFVVGIRGAAVAADGLATIGALRTEPGDADRDRGRVRLRSTCATATSTRSTRWTRRPVALAMSAADPEDCTLERTAVVDRSGPLRPGARRRARTELAAASR